VGVLPPSPSILKFYTFYFHEEFCNFSTLNTKFGMGGVGGTFNKKRWGMRVNINK
jgi:hypothetical protein